jgi:hypothetical protein
LHNLCGRPLDHWALRASSTCSNPNSILNATYGWLAEGMLAAGNFKAPKIGDFIPLVQVGYIMRGLLGMASPSLAGIKSRGSATLEPYVISRETLIKFSRSTGNIE